MSDLRWWTGWGARETNRALAALDVVEVDLDGVPGVLLADDGMLLGCSPLPEPAAALLPALDPDTDGLEGARLVPR